MPAADPSLLVEITDDGSRTLVRGDSLDTYHSSSGALAETRHVYLHNSGVTRRLAARQSTRVLEVGLGTGMAMLLTLDQALANRTPLHYEAIEIGWPSAEVLRELQPQHWGERPQLVADFLAWRETLADNVPLGDYRWHPADEIQVVVHIADARSWEARSDEPFDAIYFDPFAPQRQPELWSAAVFTRLGQLLSPAGRLVTYCVSRDVREAMQHAGLQLTRVPGPPGGKREVLIASPR